MTERDRETERQRDRVTERDGERQRERSRYQIDNDSMRGNR